MKNTKIIKWLMAPLLIIAGILLLKSCKKNDAVSHELSMTEQFTAHKNVNNAALEKVITDIKIQLAQKDFTSDFIKWHGQPLWDKAITLKKNSTNFIVLIPTQKDNNIETFIAARLKDDRLTYEMHRRTAMDKKITEPSWMNITNRFRQTILGYFNNSILGKVDNTDIPPVSALVKSSASSNGIHPDNYIQLCFNSGYCGPDACPPDSPEGGVCCITRLECVNVWYDDDGGPGIDPGPGGGGGNPPPDPCPTANWYTENPPAPGGGGGGIGGGDPCGSGNCGSLFNQVQNLPVSEERSSVSKQYTKETRTDTKIWKFHTMFAPTPLLMSPYSFYSIDTLSVVKDINDKWYFTSLKHVGKFEEGVVGGLSVSCDNLTAIPYISPNGLEARMNLTYNIRQSLICSGFPLSVNMDYSSTSPIWHP